MNRVRKFLYLIVLVAISIKGYAQDDKIYYENAIYKETIKTVQMYLEGFELSDPVYELGQEVPLVFKFDDLTVDINDYYYTIVHCDANWIESFMPQADYLDGFASNPLDDYALSFNTTFDYVNYQLYLPNENVQFKVSGNYALVVYEDNSMENVVLSQRFYVVEPMVAIEGMVRRATTDAFKGEHHEVDFTVFHEKLEIQNPREEVKIVITQNNRWDNAITNLKPLFIRGNSLVYDYNRENVFKAGNEYRYFDIRATNMNGEGVMSTDFFRPYYHKTLAADEIRSNQKFFQYQEMNGKYVVESQDPATEDCSIECDYFFVHFTLPLESILLGGSVNVFGELTNWNANKSNEMTWNFDKSAYELTLLLKQGYYNYIYVYVPQGATVADHVNLEGSYWETENNYQVYVYYRELAGRYDRLVGFREFNSRAHPMINNY